MLKKFGSNSSHRLWLKEDSAISPLSVETFSKKGMFVIKTKSLITLLNFYPCSVCLLWQF